MIEASVLPGFLLAVTLVVVAPGPDNTYIAAVALDRGPRAGLVSAFGMSMGMVVHVCLAALGVAVFLGSTPWALTVLPVVGAGYLGWLAVATYRHRGAGETSRVARDGRLLRRAVVTNLTNPKVILFFAAFLPQFCRGGSGPVALRMVVLGVIFLLIGLLSDSLIGVVVGRLGRTVSPRGRAGRILSTVAAATFATLGTALLVEVVAG